MIAAVEASQRLDSRGNPTVQVEVETSKGKEHRRPGIPILSTESDMGCVTRSLSRARSVWRVHWDK